MTQRHNPRDRWIKLSHIALAGYKDPDLSPDLREILRLFVTCATVADSEVLIEMVCQVLETEPPE